MKITVRTKGQEGLDFDEKRPVTHAGAERTQTSHLPNKNFKVAAIEMLRRAMENEHPPRKPKAESVGREAEEEESRAEIYRAEQQLQR